MEESFKRNTKPMLELESPQGATVEAAGLFTDDLILEILCRLPVRSLHRFKCVSVAWRDLIADPANRRMLPQTLAGFLYTSYRSGHHHHHLASVSGGAAPFDPSLPYLQPNKYKDMEPLDACNGLLLYRGCTKNKLKHLDRAEDDFRFVVCNPVTGRWVELPPQTQPQEPVNGLNRVTGLAFDPTVSSHFHVLRFEETYFETHYVTEVNIYSSRTGVWSPRDTGMIDKVMLFFSSKCVFVDSMMYVIGNQNDINEYVLLGVDMEGKVWKTIRLPYGRKFGTIGSSQGCLHYAITPVDDNNKQLVSEIELWWLKDCDSKELVLKHTASIDKLMSTTGLGYRVAEIHPDCDTIFLGSYGVGILAAYDMRHQKVGCILNLEITITLWHRFLPYVPLFLESLADADGQ